VAGSDSEPTTRLPVPPQRDFGGEATQVVSPPRVPTQAAPKRETPTTTPPVHSEPPTDQIPKPGP
jgi:hypothetical protein